MLRIPDDFDEHEVYRYITGFIAQVEENSDYTWDDIADLLEQKGFKTIKFILGPSFD